MANLMIVLQNKANEALQEANSSSLQSFTLQALPGCVELILYGDQVQFCITFVAPAFRRSQDKTAVMMFGLLSHSL